MRTICFALFLLCACGTGPTSWDNDALSGVLSIGSLSRRPVYSSVDPPQIVGVEIEVDVINVGYGSIDVPFTITWALTDAQGNVSGSASLTRRDYLNPGASWHVSLSIAFPPVQSLDDLQDVVTFDLVPG